MAKNKKILIIPAIKIPRTIEREYLIQLNKLGKGLVTSVRADVINYLKENYTPESVLKETPESLINNSVRLSLIKENLNTFASSSASRMVNNVNRTNKTKFNNSILRVTGVDIGSVVNEEKLNDFLNISISKNVSLIKSIPEQYLTQVETIVSNGLLNGLRYSTVEKQIIAATGANGKLARRIKTIARNEVQTINSQLTLQRSLFLGVTQGIYRTSEDEIVRPCHAELNGVTYDLTVGAWSKTCKKYIQPGITDINCRCRFSPILII